MLGGLAAFRHLCVTLAFGHIFTFHHALVFAHPVTRGDHATGESGAGIAGRLANAIVDTGMEHYRLPDHRGGSFEDRHQLAVDLEMPGAFDDLDVAEVTSVARRIRRASMLGLQRIEMTPGRFEVRCHALTDRVDMEAMRAGALDTLDGSVEVHGAFPLSECRLPHHFSLGVV